MITDYANSDVTGEVSYLFKKAGCTVDVFCSKKSWLLKNRYWDSRVIHHNASPLEYTKGLESLVKAQKYDWVVVGDDVALKILNDHITDEHLARMILPVSKLENRMMVGSKAGLHLLCKEYGITSPEGFVYESLFQMQKLLATFSFPLLLKIDTSGAGEGVFFCNTMDEVEARLKILKDDQKKSLLFQEYISGDLVGVEALFREGNLLAYNFSIVSKNVTGEFSVSCERQFKECREIEKNLVEIGSRLSINGFTSATFIFDKAKQKYYLIEADLRPQVWFPLAKFVGVDFSLAISHYLSKKNILIRPSLPKGKETLVVPYFPRRISYALRHFEFGEIFRWLFNKEDRWQFIPPYDRRLFLALFQDITMGLVWRIYNLKYLFPIRFLCRKLKYGLFTAVER